MIFPQTFTVETFPSDQTIPTVTQTPKTSHPQQKRKLEVDLGDPSQSPPESRPHTRTHIRVCITCRKRKVRCDKKQPCSSCVKSHTECVFPAMSSTGGRGAAADAELLYELKRMEPVLKSFLSKIDETGVGHGLEWNSGNLEVLPASAQGISTLQIAAGGGKTQSESFELSPSCLAESPGLNGLPLTNESPAPGSNAISWNACGQTPGMLVKDQGRQVYVGGLFWQALRTEGDEFSEPLSDESDDEGEGGSPETYTVLHDLQYLTRECSSKTDLRSLHPSREQRIKSWQIFVENVHPVVAVLHIPTIEPEILTVMASADVRPLPRSLAPLVFVTYYGAITSISMDACRDQFGEEQNVLLERYRLGVQQALVRAKLLETDDIRVLQAFVIYLTLLKRHDTKLSWSLTGLAIRLAQSLGMHRDGSLLKLSKFDAEMRRRLWWTICLLDTSSSKDYCSYPAALEMSVFDAALPRNLNDADLGPDMIEYPPESRQMTDICFAYVRWRVTDIWRTMIDSRRASNSAGQSFASMTLTEKESWISEQRRELEKVFFLQTSVMQPLHWVTELFIRVHDCNMRLFIYDPLSPHTVLHEEVRSRIFFTAIQCLEYSHQLRSDDRSKKWAWLLSCDHEWFALAVVLSELCSRPLGRHVEQGWRVVEQNVVLRWNCVPDHRKAHHWRSIMKAVDKARSERKKALKCRHSLSDSFGRAHAGKVPPEFETLSFINQAQFNTEPRRQTAQFAEQSQSPWEVQSISFQPDSATTMSPSIRPENWNLCSPSTFEACSEANLDPSILDIWHFESLQPNIRPGTFQ